MPLPPLRQLVQMVLDKASAKKLEDDSGKSLKKVEGKFDGVLKAAKRLGGVLLAAFSVRAIGRFINDVEEARRTLIRLTGASGALLNTLSRDTLAVFAQVPESIGDVSTAIGNLNTLLGITDEPLQHITKAALDFARANRVDVATATLTVGQLLNRYGLSADAAIPFMDRLTVAGQATGASVTELAQRLLESGPVLDQLGFSTNEQIGLFAEFERRGIKTTEAAAGLNRVFTNLAREGLSDGPAAFDEFIRRIKAAPSDLAAGAVAAEAFGERAGAKMAVDIRAGAFEIDELVESLRNADGALADTEERSRTTTDELKASANALKARLAPAISVATTAVSLFVRAVEAMVTGWENSVLTGIRTFYEIEAAAISSWVAVKGLLGFDTSAAETKLGAVKQLISDINDEINATPDPTKKLIGGADAVAAAAASFDASKGGGGGTPGPRKLTDEEMAAAKARADEAAKLTESLRTPQEVYDEEVARLVAFLQTKSITEETYNRGVVAAAVKLQEELAKVTADAQATAVADAQARLNTGLQTNATLAALMGDSYDSAAQQVSLLTAAMQELAAAGLDPMDERLQGLAQRLRVVQAEARLTSASQENMAAISSAAGEVVNAALGAGIGQLAAGKSQQNAIMAAEQLALGFVSALNPFTAPKAAGHFAAAAKFAAISAAWGTLAGSTGGFSAGGGGGGIGAAGAPTGATGGQGSVKAEPVGPELNVFFEGPGFDAVNPRVQRVVSGAIQEHTERAGKNTRVRINRSRGTSP